MTRPHTVPKIPGILNTVRLLAVIPLLGMLMLAGAAVQADEFGDAEITLAVADALADDKGVSGYMIDVDVDNGIVTLSGTSDNILAKERAVDITETIKGVRAVVNDIQVVPSARTDNEIREDIETSLMLDPATESFELETEVNDGIVTLTGVVESWQEKQLAASIAKRVEGVLDLKNRVTVDYTAERSTEEIKAEVERVLEWDALVDDALISVSVSEDVVSLSGTVGSAAEKTRAAADAWVIGVQEVRTDNLVVESWARDERFRKDKYVRKSDASVEEAVSEAMMYDPRVSSFEIDVSADDGVVTLEGTVDNLKAKRSAGMDARNTVGVWRVKNMIQVRPGTPSDETIEERVENALLHNPHVNRHEIDATVVNGTVYLNGRVDTYFEKAEADDEASRVYGVVEVENNLEVTNTYDRLTYDPYVDQDWYAYDYPWYQQRDAGMATRSDWEVASDIDDELFWSPFVDEADVNVTVEDGVATLTGTVDTWHERQAAAENAYEAGAVAVDNNLTVEYGPRYYVP
ncbi:BON domain-containing protein [candidate division GN15 bacterium]|nr:BON domain-containing protein [candidate division GN15 bacterium]